MEGPAQARLAGWLADRLAWLAGDDRLRYNGWDVGSGRRDERGNVEELSTCSTSRDSRERTAVGALTTDQWGVLLVHVQAQSCWIISVQRRIFKTGRQRQGR